MNMRRIIEFMWLAIAAVSAVEMYIGFSESGFSDQHFQLFGILFVTAGFMYFFRKRQRKNIENRKNQS